MSDAELFDDLQALSLGDRVTSVGARHSITRRARRARVPQTDEQRAAPLHVHRMRPMNVAAVRLRMSPSVRQRFDDVWGVMFSPPSVAEAAALRTLRPRFSELRLSDAHARQMAVDGVDVAEPADGPGPLRSGAFTVFEERAAGDRQRPIVWTVDGNALAGLRGYEPRLPLAHIATYLPTVHEAVGSTRDLKASFFQVAIPEASRGLFTFRSAAGDWWRLRRMPMGHSCAPELMQILTGCIGGDPRYADEPYVASDVRVTVWVDNVRFVGAPRPVAAAAAAADACAAAVGATWNTAETVDGLARYDFLGVEWDHAAKTVRPTRRLRAKIAAADLSSPLPAGEYETFLCRLLYASAISGSFPGEHWFAIKHARRVTNQLNRNMLHVDSPVAIPPAVRRSLELWRASVDVCRVVPRVPPDTEHTLFVDASSQGWGAVLVTAPDMSVAVTGDRWDADFAGSHINVQEAEALNRAVSSLLPSRARGRVVIKVDNTSVQGVARKGISERSAALTGPVVSALRVLRARGVAWDIGYIRTDLNPADRPSRVWVDDWSATDADFIEAQVRDFFALSS